MGSTLDNNLISRQAVEEMIKAEMPERGMWEIEGDTVKETVCEVCVDLIQELYKLQPATPKEKTGHWINAKVGKLFPSNDFKCSECGNILDFNGVNCGRGDANYCPNCGCHMVEPHESEG